MYDDFEKVNADECDKFVDDSIRTLGSIARTMKDKELPQI